MSRAPAETRKEARRLFLSGEMATNADIAGHLRVKPHTISKWRREEAWDDMWRKAEKHHAERHARAIYSRTVRTNQTHMKLWEVLLAQLAETLAHPDLAKVKLLEMQAAIIERGQKGQRLGRGLNLEGVTEERIRADTNAAVRKLIDLFIDIVKEHVPDEETRDRIGQRLLAAVPRQAGVGASDEDEPGDDGSVG